MKNAEEEIRLGFLNKKLRGSSWKTKKPARKKK